MGKLINVPNLLSFIRLPLALLIVYSYNHPVKYFLVLILIVSDKLDGMMARKMSVDSSLGEVIDPAFDKISAFTIFVLIFPQVGLMDGFVFLFFLRDIFVSFGVLFTPIIDIPDKSIIKARFSGKIVTTAQFACLFFLIVPLTNFLKVSIWFVAISSVWAIADYLILLSDELRDTSFRHNSLNKSLIYVSCFGVMVVLGLTVFNSELGEVINILV